MDGADPTLKTTRITVEEIGRGMRNEGVWFNGIDWVERRMNLWQEEAEERERRRVGARQREDKLA